MTDTDFADLRERFIWVIHEFAGSDNTRFLYQYLGQRYGIDARKWKNVCNRVQQPSFDMIAALCSDRPHFLSWVIYGRALNTIQVDPTEEDWKKELMDHHTASVRALVKDMKKIEKKTGN